MKMEKTDNKLFYRKLRQLSLPIIFQSLMLSLVAAGDAVLIEIGSAYLRIAGWSYLLTGISQCCLTVIKVTDHVKPCAWISSSAVILNILFNAVFIFELLGVPQMEARGAALATTLSRVAELGLCLIISRGGEYIRPAWRRFFRGNRLLFHDFRKQCVPLMGASLFWGLLYFTGRYCWFMPVPVWTRWERFHGC